LSVEIVDASDPDAIVVAIGTQVLIGAGIEDAVEGVEGGHAKPSVGGGSSFIATLQHCRDSGYIHLIVADSHWRGTMSSEQEGIA